MIKWLFGYYEIHESKIPWTWYLCRFRNTSHIQYHHRHISTPSIHFQSHRLIHALVRSQGWRRRWILNWLWSPLHFGLLRSHIRLYLLKDRTIVNQPYIQFGHSHPLESQTNGYGIIQLLIWLNLDLGLFCSHIWC